MWNQWATVPPPLPSPTTVNPQPPMIGPVQPSAVAPTPSSSVPITNAPPGLPNSYAPGMGAPSYTPAQYAAMTPEQQYAVQQHWQQWQAYEQQYAQWHAQYGEQYKREMAAIHGAVPPTMQQYNPTSIPAPAPAPAPAAASAPVPAPTSAPPCTMAPVSNAYSYPPPGIPNVYPTPVLPIHAPPPPPPDNATSMGVKAPPQIYDRPPPPPPPPQQDERKENTRDSTQTLNPHHFATGSGYNPGTKYSQPPPPLSNYDIRKSAGIQDKREPEHGQHFNSSSTEKQWNKQNVDREEDVNNSSDFNRQQEGRNTRQQPRNYRGMFSNRFDNYEHKNVNQQSGSNWNSGIHKFTPGNQQQQQHTQQQHTQQQQSQQQQSKQQQSQQQNLHPQDNIKSNTGNVDEKLFDEQFRLWEEQFENWKRENANHPDRTMYMQYEREFEKTRIRLLERREQMRRRKMMQLQESMPPRQLDKRQRDVQEKQLCQETENIPERKDLEENELSQSKYSLKEAAKGSENADPIKNKSDLETNTEECISENETHTHDENIFKNTEISEIFKPTDGIPGLDLVKSNEGIQDTDLETETVSEIVDLDCDGPSRPSKAPFTSIENKESEAEEIVSGQGSQQSFSLNKQQTEKKKIPSLFDIVVEMPQLSPNSKNRSKSPGMDLSSLKNKSPRTEVVPTAPVIPNSRSRSISKDRESLVSPNRRPSSQLSSTSQQQQFVPNPFERQSDGPIHQLLGNAQQSNLPPEIAHLAQALQDPNVMQLLTVALAQVQQTGGINQFSGNPQQAQLIQQLQHLQPLIQMQQERAKINLNQSFSNLQSSGPHPGSESRTWQNQLEQLNMNIGSNFNQNRNSWGGNLLTKNNPPFRHDLRKESSGSGSGSESFNEAQQKNSNIPNNPFRRSTDSNRGSDTSFSGGNFTSSPLPNNRQNPFNVNREQSLSGPFSGKGNNLQQREEHFGEVGLFNNSRPSLNFGNSLGYRNNANNFGDRGSDDTDYYRPAQVFDYQNRSRGNAIISPAKVVEYGHKPSAVMTTNSFNCGDSEFVPVKTIDYGHASNIGRVDNQLQEKKILPKDKINKPKFCESTTNKKSTKRQGCINKQLGEKKYKKKGEKNKIGNKSDNKTWALNTPAEEFKDEGELYPRNKWVLQNPETRLRPGPPTKRGKRNPYNNDKQKIPSANNAIVEENEIDEHFEEISDNEELSDKNNMIKLDTQRKPLFPSVSDSIANSKIVFPSMENNNTIPIDEILFKPGRLTRPKNIVIIIRGPPGSGKSYIAKLIKDKEVEMGGPTPRLLSIDDYFMIENDYEEKCPKTGRKIPKKEILYEYEKEMEDTYMQYLIKSFKKTISDHLFDFIIVDCCNQSLRTFNEFYNAARDGNFSPFVVDMICDIDVCLNQNIHERREEEIKEIIDNYQECPGHYIKLDVTNLLENVVEMEDVSDLEDNFIADAEENHPDDDEETNDNNGGGFLKSKWDTDPTTENLARLDGTSKPISRRGTATLEEYLQIDGWEPPSSSANGKKRVRWADIEEKRAQDKMRAIGFVVGQTDWNRMMDPTSGSGALTKTKYIERLNKRR